jgi:anti-anti-sigma factor
MSRVTVVAAHAGDVLERPACALTSQVLLVRAAADLDAASEAAARRELAAVCTEDGAATWVLLYLGERLFVGVRGLGVLLDAADLARRRGRQLLIVGPPPCLKRMVDVLGLHQRLWCMESAWEAAAVVAADDRAHDGAGRGRAGG